jgi:uncharacterized iron-regulated membrane protein
MSSNKTNRTLHKWGSIIIALPFLVVLVTGVLLLLKKQFSFIQPPTINGQSAQPSLSFEQILTVAKTVESAQISSWDDIDRLDVRPAKGMLKVRSNNNVEVQIDSGSGEVLHVAIRRTDFIESIHDGTFFEKNANLWLMLPVAFISIVLLISGVILFFVPYLKRKNVKTISI